MPEQRSRHLAGPVLLIIIGLALLLDRVGIWSFSWAYLWRYWPLVLVLIGLEILLGRTRAGGLLFVVLTLALVAGAALLLPSAGGHKAFDEHRDINVPLGAATSASVRVEIGVGNLTMTSLEESDNLLEATADYDTRHTEISAETEHEADQVHVELKTSHESWTSVVSDTMDRWEIGLSPALPLRLDIVGGVNNARIDLSELNLTRLGVKVGVGEMDVVLAERGGYDALFSGGVGMLTIRVPNRVEARVRIDGGLGSVDLGPRFETEGRHYVTEGYAGAEDAINIEIDGGIGSVHVR